MTRSKHQQLLYKATERLETPIIGFHKITSKKDHVFHLLDFGFRTNQNMQYISLTGTKSQSFHQTSSG